MMDDLLLDVGQGAKLWRAFHNADWTLEDIARLSGSGLLRDVRQVLHGDAQIVVIEHTIDCDADPCIPEGWSVEEHRKGGQWKWDASQVQTWLSTDQKRNKSVEGNDLRKEVHEKVPCNANVLEYLLAHPLIIPKEWEGRYVYFWGTIYRDSNDRLGVRCLFRYDDGRWYPSLSLLDGHWRNYFPAAVLVAS